MNSKLTNVNIEIPDQQATKLNQSPTKREMVSSARRPPTSPSARQTPIKHEPCSSTLGKFHDSVNFSLCLDTTRSKSHHQPEEPTHRVIEAKNKYKYMVRQKSFVDESLFGSTSARRPASSDLNRYSNGGTHLTHDLMSNLAPFIVNPPIRSQLNSARSVTNELNKIDQTITKETRDTNSAKRPIKPWKP